MHCVRSVAGATEIGPKVTLYDPGGVTVLPLVPPLVPEGPPELPGLPELAVGCVLLQLRKKIVATRSGVRMGTLSSAHAAHRQSHLAFRPRCAPVSYYVFIPSDAMSGS